MQSREIMCDARAVTKRIESGVEVRHVGGDLSDKAACAQTRIWR